MTPIAMARSTLVLALLGGPVVLAAGAPQADACRYLTRSEAEGVLGNALTEGRVAVKDLATECSYVTAATENRRTALTIALYETGRAGLRGSAADYFADVRRTSMHLGLAMRSVEVGDEAYWLGGVLHVRKGQDLSLAIEIPGAAADAATTAEAERMLTLSTEVAAIILGKVGTPTPTRETLTIATNTQAHRKELRIAVGNIWRESYTPEGGAARDGLTAMLDIGVPDDASRRQRVRVHAGQTLRVFGSVLYILSIEPSRVRLTLDRDAP